MRKQTEFRTYSQRSRDACWSAGDDNKKSGKCGHATRRGLLGLGQGHEEQSSTLLGVRQLLLWMLILTSSLTFGQSARISKDLQDLPSDSSVDVIIQYQTPPGDSEFKHAATHGAKNGKALSLVKGMRYTMQVSAASDLVEEDPNVEYISPDRPVQGMTDSSTLDYYDTTVNAQIGWQLGYNGTGIGVAVIDSGIMPNGDLSNSKGSRIVYAQSFLQGLTYPDQYGHGTHVAGIVGGNGSYSTGSAYTYTFKGIAPNVNLINFRVLDQNGTGTDSAVISAIQQAITLKLKYNIRIINLSLGRPVYESYSKDPLCQAVESAWKAGIVVVVAAGNEGRNNSANTSGYGTITAPGNDPYVITVGAMKTMGTPSRADDLIASYSSKGPTLYDHVVKPDIVAPGNRIISLYLQSLTLPTLYPGNEIPQSLYTIGNISTPSPIYFRLSGTSMAAPMVSGAAALMLQKTPSLTPDQVKARLMKSAYKVFPQYSSATDPTTGASYTSQYDIFAVGAGYLDVQAALSSTDLAPATSGSAMSPAVTVDASGNVVLVNGSSVIWGNSVLWGTSVVWGTSVLWGTNVSGQSILWGSSVCWGSSTTQGYSVLWGSSVVWGTTSTDATEATALTINGEN